MGLCLNLFEKGTMIQENYVMFSCPKPSLRGKVNLLNIDVEDKLWQKRKKMKLGNGLKH